MLRLEKFYKLVASYVIYNEINIEGKLNSGLKNKILDFSALTSIIWEYNLANNSFSLIRSNTDFHNIPTQSIKKFILGIKFCFQDYFFDYFIEYVKYLMKSKVTDEVSNFRSLLPLELNENQFYLISLFIIPEFSDSKLVNLYFVAFPNKEYEDEIISLGVCKCGTAIVAINKEIRKKITSPILLTSKQQEVFGFVHEGFSSQEIALILNTKVEAVFKINIRIKERLSKYFSIDFSNIAEAVNYYKRCFLND